MGFIADFRAQSSRLLSTRSSAEPTFLQTSSSLFSSASRSCGRRTRTTCARAGRTSCGSCRRSRRAAQWGRRLLSKSRRCRRRWSRTGRRALMLSMEVSGRRQRCVWLCFLSRLGLTSWEQFPSPAMTFYPLARHVYYARESSPESAKKALEMASFTLRKSVFLSLSDYIDAAHQRYDSQSTMEEFMTKLVEDSVATPWTTNGLSLTSRRCVFLLTNPRTPAHPLLDALRSSSAPELFTQYLAPPPSFRRTHRARKHVGRRHLVPRSRPCESRRRVLQRRGCRLARGGGWGFEEGGSILCLGEE